MAHVGHGANFDPNHVVLLRLRPGLMRYTPERAQAFHREVVAAGTPSECVHFELFPGTHRGLTWRYPLSLAFLVGRLSSTL